MAEQEMGKHNGHRDERHRPAGGARLLPRVTFGLGVAVLTGAVVVSASPAPRAAGAEHVMTTTALGAVINEAGAAGIPTLTTCCGNY
jgi:hypothetical protein